MHKCHYEWVKTTSCRIVASQNIIISKVEYLTVYLFTLSIVQLYVSHTFLYVYICICYVCMFWANSRSRFNAYGIWYIAVRDQTSGARRHDRIWQELTYAILWDSHRMSTPAIATKRHNIFPSTISLYSVLSIILTL